MTRTGRLLVLICPGPWLLLCLCPAQPWPLQSDQTPGVNLDPWLFSSSYPWGHGALGLVDSRCSLGPASELVACDSQKEVLGFLGLSASAGVLCPSRCVPVTTG